MVYAETIQRQKIKAMWSLERVRKELSEMNQHIDQVAMNMSRLSDPSNSNLIKEFGDFEKRITMVEYKTEKIINKVEEMKSNSLACFSLWKKERKLGRIGLEGHKDQYQRVLLELEIAAKIFTAYLDGLYGIRDLLHDNLDSSGVQSAIPLINQTSGEGRSVKLQMDAINRLLGAGINAI